MFQKIALLNENKGGETPGSQCEHYNEHAHGSTVERGRDVFSADTRCACAIQTHSCISMCDSAMVRVSPFNSFRCVRQVVRTNKGHPKLKSSDRARTRNVTRLCNIPGHKHMHPGHTSTPASNQRPPKTKRLNFKLGKFLAPLYM